MDKLEYNSIEDLVFDRSFREWVRFPGGTASAFWESWIAQNPDKQELVNHSKAIIHALQLNFRTLSHEEIDHEITRILQRAAAGPELVDSRPLHRFSAAWKIAAVMLALFLGWYLFQQRQQPRTDPFASYLQEHKNTLTNQVNETDTIQRLLLPDGSKVLLEPNSTLTWPPVFSRDNRTVYLTGAAFFEVTKDPARPFMVCTQSMITKVLGTSFSIRAYASDQKEIVVVHTGKVSVFKRESFGKTVSKNKELGGIIVTPNQEVIYSIDKKELNKTVAEKPLLLVPQADKASFVFNATPVAEVFKTMQDAYGINIVYDEEIMSTCSLTAAMGNETFYEKLDMICKAINASYEMMDGNVLITSRGCN